VAGRFGNYGGLKRKSRLKRNVATNKKTGTPAKNRDAPPKPKTGQDTAC
jgi:nucleoid DNA-binding protein